MINELEQEKYFKIPFIWTKARRVSTLLEIENLIKKSRFAENMEIYRTQPDKERKDYEKAFKFLMTPPDKQEEYTAMNEAVTIDQYLDSTGGKNYVGLPKRLILKFLSYFNPTHSEIEANNNSNRHEENHKFIGSKTPRKYSELQLKQVRASAYHTLTNAQIDPEHWLKAALTYERMNKGKQAVSYLIKNLKKSGERYMNLERMVDLSEIKNFIKRN